MNLNKIHEDNRGSIHIITDDLINLKEITVIKTKAGIMRGGCIHRNNIEHLCVVEGHIQYFYRWPETTEIFFSPLGPGQTISIPINTPHYFLSLTDSVVIEWGPDPSEKQEKHEEFRNIVLAHNAKLDINRYM